MEKVRGGSNLEFGGGGMFGCVGWGVCGWIVGMMLRMNNEFVLWVGCGCGVMVGVLAFLAKRDGGCCGRVGNGVGGKDWGFRVKVGVEVLREGKVWFL